MNKTGFLYKLATFFEQPTRAGGGPRSPGAAGLDEAHLLSCALKSLPLPTNVGSEGHFFPP